MKALALMIYRSLRLRCPNSKLRLINFDNKLYKLSIKASPTLKKAKPTKHFDTKLTYFAGLALRFNNLLYRLCEKVKVYISKVNFINKLADFIKNKSRLIAIKTICSCIYMNLLILILYI